MAKGPALCSIEIVLVGFIMSFRNGVQSGRWDCVYHADLLFSSRVTLMLGAVQVQSIYMEENRSQNFLMTTHM